MNDIAPRTNVILQSGAIPYRVRGRRIEFLLVTNSRRSRWIVPKGHVAPGLAASASAALEAWEEAGVIGHIEQSPVGDYRFRKQGRHYLVQLYPLLVTDVSDVWPEMSCRQRCWLTPSAAIKRVWALGIRRGIAVVRDRVQKRRVA